MAKLTIIQNALVERLPLTNFSKIDNLTKFSAICIGKVLHVTDNLRSTESLNIRWFLPQCRFGLFVAGLYSTRRLI